jgi:hypothetical protein
MYVVGTICSVLTYAGLTGITIFLTSPFWIIYSMINASMYSNNWEAYKSYTQGWVYQEGLWI